VIRSSSCVSSLQGSPPPDFTMYFIMMASILVQVLEGFKTVDV
jgi:hypothetical protein